jgi:hypothetical protein
MGGPTVRLWPSLMIMAAGLPGSAVIAPPAAETIAKNRLSYWSGPVTASTGVGVRVPGQLTALNAVSLSTAVTAFALQAVVLGTSTSWNPTIVVAVPASAVAGTYTGTVTHSVA